MKFIKCKKDILNVEKLEKVYINNSYETNRFPLESYDVNFEFEDSKYTFEYCWEQETRENAKENSELLMLYFAGFMKSKREFFDADAIYNKYNR